MCVCQRDTNDSILYDHAKYVIFSLKVKIVLNRGGVEDTKTRRQGQGQPYRGHTLSRPSTGMLEAKAKDIGHRGKCSPKKRSSRKIFRRSPKF